MCCFSQPVEWVAGTRIFARPSGRGTQLLAYAMNFSAAGDLAMILPLPVPPGAGEDAVRFIDLSGYGGLFDDLAAGFPVEWTADVARGGPVPPPAAKLAVHDVGRFEASFVPTIADFGRLDERFRLPGRVWDALPGYGDHGFAVFKLKDQRSLLGRVLGRKARGEVHPMAFEFRTRAPERAFFPTMHVHDQAVHATAEFDHTLYLQPAAGARPGGPGAWDESFAEASRFVDVERARGLVLGTARCYRRSIAGEHENADVWA